MIVEKVSTSNFLGLSGGCHDFGAVTLLTGPSGSGKSSVVWAVRWALFGTPRIPGDVDSVIGADPSPARVTVWFSHNGCRYRVERSRERGTTRAGAVTLAVSRFDDARGWMPFGDRGVTAAQKRIASILGVDAALAEAAMFVDADGFIMARPEDRRRVLLSVLPDTRVWEGAHARAEGRHKALKARVAELSAGLTTTNDNIAGVDEDEIALRAQMAQAGDLDELRAAWEAARGRCGDPEGDRARARELAEARRGDHEKAVEERAARIRRIEDGTALFNDLAAALDAADRDAATAGAAREEVAAAEAREREAADAVVAARSSQWRRAAVEELRADPRCCPLCRAAVDEDRIRSIEERLSDEGGDVIVAQAHLSAVREGLARARDRLERAQSDVRGSSARLSVMEDRARAFASSTASGDGLCEDLGRVLDEETAAVPGPPVMPGPGEEEAAILARLESGGGGESEVQAAWEAYRRREQMDDTLASLTAEREGFTEDLGQLTVERGEAEAALAAAGELVRACAPKGIPTWLMSGVLDRLASRHNALLEVCAAGAPALRVSYESTRITRGRQKETLDIMVSVEGGAPRPVEALSGGERAVVTATAALAMAWLINDDAPGSLGSLFMDETLGGLDERAAGSVASALSAMQDAAGVSGVTVVTHDRPIIDALSPCAVSHVFAKEK